MYRQVIGGPGTGKTLEIARRIAGLVNSGVSPETIVALTFTQNAAGTLRRRVQDYLANPDQAELTTISTFHTFCANLTKSYAEEVGLTKQWRMVDFLDIHNTTRLRNKIDLFTPNQIYDFTKAMELGRDILVKHSENYTDLFVDEFQDCDRLQWEIVTTMANSNPKLNVTCVGDPNQEIYQFLPNHMNGAFEAMRRNFKNVEVHHLTENKRSSKSVVDYCNKVVGQNTSATRDVEGVVAYVESSSLNLFEDIKQLINSLPYKKSDIAILTRNNKDVVDAHYMLNELGVPVNALVSIRGIAVQKTVNMALTLLKWSITDNDAYLIQLLHQNKQISSRRIVLIGASNVIKNLEIQRRQKTPLWNYLSATKQAIQEARTCDEVKGVIFRFVDSWEWSKPLTKREKEAWNTVVRALDSKDDTVYGEPIEAATAVLKLVMSGETETPIAEDKVSILTKHAAKSRQWPVVIALFPFDDLKRERNLDYVTISRAVDRLYLFGEELVLPYPVTERIKYSVPDGLSLKEATKQYPRVFKPIWPLDRRTITVKS